MEGMEGGERGEGRELCTWPYNSQRAEGKEGLAEGMEGLPEWMRRRAEQFVAVLPLPVLPPLLPLLPPAAVAAAARRTLLRNRLLAIDRLKGSYQGAARPFVVACESGKAALVQVRSRGLQLQSLWRASTAAVC